VRFSVKQKVFAFFIETKQKHDDNYSVNKFKFKTSSLHKKKSTKTLIDCPYFDNISAAVLSSDVSTKQFSIKSSDEQN